MTKRNITVFGATGKIGTALVSLLSSNRISTIAVTRDKGKASEMPFVQWVEADIKEKDSLFATMSDSRTVFLLSGHSNDFVREQGNVIEVARQQGVGHIVKLSSGAADKNSTFHVARVHGEVEELIRQSGIPATILRPTAFMQNWLGELAQTVKQNRTIQEATGDGKRAYIDMRDIAAVAYKVLTEPRQHIDRTYFLTGSVAISFHDVAAAISKAIGEDVRYIQLTIEEAGQKMEQRGLPPFIAKALLAYVLDQRQGRAAAVSRDVEDILGRPARTVETFISDHLGYFK